MNKNLRESDESISVRVKRLLWQSSHRGIKEMDILMGGFALERLPSMDAGQLDLYETIIALPDQQLLAWVVGDEPVPTQHQSALLQEFLKYRPVATSHD